VKKVKKNLQYDATFRNILHLFLSREYYVNKSVMKTTVQISFIFILSAFCLVSCGSAESSENESVRLSAKQVELMPESDTTIITAQGPWWWISDIDVDGKRLYANPEDIQKTYMGIEGDWFTVEKISEEKLMVKVSQNKSRNSRKMVITLESGNYFDYISVLQKGRN